MTRAKNRLRRVTAAPKKLRDTGAGRKLRRAGAGRKRMVATPRWRWVAGGLAAAAALGSAGVAVVNRVRRRSPDQTGPTATAAANAKQPPAQRTAVRKAVGAASTAATTVRDRTGSLAHRAAEGARHTAARAREATRGQDQPNGHSGEGHSGEGRTGDGRTGDGHTGDGHSSDGGTGEGRSGTDGSPAAHGAS